MKKPKAYMVATAHLDTVWNWTLEETVKEYLRATLDRNFALIEKYPHYRFNFEGAYRYDLIREYYPEDFERVKRYVAEGRWCVTGSSWENGDVVTPAPETLMRNVLYGNRFFEEHFGKKSSDIFLPDCFGFPKTLPSIMRHMGLSAFSSQKLTWNLGEAGYRLPFDVGIWQGIDGSEVVAVLDPGPYVTSLTERPSRDRELYDRISLLPAGKTMRYYGTGDQGGAPDDDSARLVEEAVTDPDALTETVSAYAGQLADELTPEERALLPRTADELLMITHGVGSYTSVAPAKRFHRNNELKAIFAEESAVFAAWLGAREYPKKTLTKAWRDFIRHEFHDDLTGTSVLRAYRETFHDDIVVNNTLDGEIAFSLASIARNADTEKGEGRKLVVFNPAAYARRSVAEVLLPVGEDRPEALAVFAPDGSEVPSQIAGRDEKGTRLLFLAALPSLGYAVYRVLPAEKPFRKEGLSVSENRLENERLSVGINEEGDISSVYDKENGVELLREPVRFEILWNSFLCYGSWEIGYDDLIAEPRAILSGPCRTEITEDGPCRVSLRIERTKGVSRFVETLSLDAGGDLLTVSCRVNWHESRSLLKAAFPLDLDGETVRYDAGLGNVERGDRTPLKHEVPVGKWANFHDPAKDYSVTLLNDCKHGMDKSGSVLRLTLIHTPANMFRTDTRQDLQDFGENVFSFALSGSRGDFRAAGAERLGALFHTPPAVCETSSHRGILPPVCSFFSADRENVALRAVKAAEDSDEIVVRVVESAGEETRASFTLGPGVASAREINGYEEARGPALCENGRVVFTLSPFEPKSFALRLLPPPPGAEKSDYVSLPLPAQTPFTTRNENRGSLGFGEDRVSFPRELLEKEFKTAGVPFSLAEKDGAFLALIPAGEEIPLPAGTGAVHLLAARLDRDGRYSLLADGKPVSFGVQSFADDIGGWDQAGAGHAGFIREDRVALSASHTHDVTGDRVYGRFAWYLYSLTLPAGTKKIAFPADPAMMIAAVTAEKGDQTTRLVSDAVLHKKEKTPRRLTAGGNPGEGVYLPGDPPILRWGGEALGKVTWEGSDGSVRTGLSIAFDMPDRDLSFAVSLKPYRKKLPPPLRVIAGAAADGYGKENLSDGRRDTLWRAAADGRAGILFDLGVRRSFSHLALFHAGACGEDQTLNPPDYSVEYLKDGEWVPLCGVRDNILPVTSHDFPEITAQFLRLSILIPTRNGNDGRASLAALELYADRDAGEETGTDGITAYDLPHAPEDAVPLCEGTCREGDRLLFPGASLVRAWEIDGASSAGVAFFNDRDEILFLDEGKDVRRKNAVVRLTPDRAAAGIEIRRLSADGPARLTVYGVSLALTLVKKYRAADTVGSRNFFAEKRPGGAMFLPAGEGEGHDLYGFDAVLPAGYVTLSMTLRIPEEELSALPDGTVLFTFNPIFPGCEKRGKDVTAGDYRAAFADARGFRVLSDVFQNPGTGHTEGRFINFRRASLEVLDFTFFTGKP